MVKASDMEQYKKMAVQTKYNLPDEDLEMNWLESTDEYCINRGEFIIADGLSEEQANEIFNELRGFCWEDEE